MPAGRSFFEDLTEPTARALVAAAGACEELSWRAARPGGRDRLCPWAGDEVEEHDYLSVRFLEPSGLTAPDREMLAALGVEAGEGELLPEFRAARPGFLPWYPTEAEGQELLRALAGEPLMPREAADATPWTVLHRWERRRWRTRRTWEIGTVTPWRVASPPGTRPYLPRMTAVLDAESGEAYPPVIGASATPRAAALWQALANTIESRLHLPLRLRVEHPEDAALWTPLAERFGVLIECDPAPAVFSHFRERTLRSLGEAPRDYSR